MVIDAGIDAERGLRPRCSCGGNMSAVVTAGPSCIGRGRSGWSAHVMELIGGAIRQRIDERSSQMESGIAVVDCLCRGPDRDDKQQRNGTLRQRWRKSSAHPHPACSGYKGNSSPLRVPPRPPPPQRAEHKTRGIDLYPPITSLAVRRPSARCHMPDLAAARAVVTPYFLIENNTLSE